MIKIVQIRTVNEIIDVAVNNIKCRLKEENKGRDKYNKRMKNRKKLKNKR